MTRLNFGVSAGSTCGTRIVYVDDGLMGADTVSEAIHLRREMQQLFEMGCFNLCKWKANERDVLASIPEDLKDHRT